MLSLDNNEIYSSENSRLLFSRDRHLQNAVKSVSFYYYQAIKWAPSRLDDYRNLQSEYVVSEKTKIDEIVQMLNRNSIKCEPIIPQDGVLHIIFEFSDPSEKAAYFKLYRRNGELEPLSFYDRYVVNGSCLLNYLLRYHPKAFKIAAKEKISWESDWTEEVYYKKSRGIFENSAIF